MTPSSTSAASYRRSEKNFTSNRASKNGQALRPTYRGNPGCQSFVEQFVVWTSVQRSQLALDEEGVLGSPWMGHGTCDPFEFALEFSIDTLAPRPSVVKPDAPKPVKIRLPPYNHSLYLIQRLESVIGHEQHYFRRRELRAKVARMHQNPELPESKDHGWLCHWLSILALAELYTNNAETQIRSPKEPVEESELPPGIEYYDQSVALLQRVADTPDIQYVETLCLLTLFAFSLGRVNTAYMYVGLSMRAALSLDLHRDPLDSVQRSNLPLAELEHQKRVFWTVYYQDLCVPSIFPPVSLPFQLTQSQINHQHHRASLGPSRRRDHSRLCRLQPPAARSITRLLRLRSVKNWIGAYAASQPGILLAVWLRRHSHQPVFLYISV